MSLQLRHIKELCVSVFHLKRGCRCIAALLYPLNTSCGRSIYTVLSWRSLHCFYIYYVSSLRSSKTFEETGKITSVTLFSNKLKTIFRTLECFLPRSYIYTQADPPSTRSTASPSSSFHTTSSNITVSYHRTLSTAPTLAYS